MGNCNCGANLAEHESCRYTHVLNRVTPVKRIKAGNENQMWIKEGEKCPDCQVVFGGYHHIECDLERCPVCRDQLSSCGCEISSFILPKTDEELASMDLHELIPVRHTEELNLSLEVRATTGLI